MIKPKDWKWFGVPAHFICGQWCKFHMATLIGDTLVSTVGQLIHPKDAGSSEQSYYEYLQTNPNGGGVGHNRTYETMSFKAGKPCDAEGCGCGLPEIKGLEIDFEGYNDPDSATRGHMEVCMRVAERQ